MNRQNTNSIRCHVTAPFECSYLPGRQASNLVVDPGLPLNDHLLGALLNSGFRRSGAHVYRPQCNGCQECVSVRVPVKRFRPDRSQRRNWRRNRDLCHTPCAAEFQDEQFQLYRRYLASRHHDSEMSNPIPADYVGFLTSPGVRTVFHEFRLEQQLLAVAVADHTPNGLSAVYSFFDPDHPHRGLGTYAVLWLIQHARHVGLPWVYLGYWVKECRKMSYKTRFMPCEGYIDNEWRPVDATGD
ncbi:hypothetical protein Tel_10095 [Candidatus Tenderia electrophaga]|jgi:arginine-tRNA-protein transferase|uniref:Aspartate/glutamate leucyltransferase n=1 Tax=Candidatus Tenderia electrophaga TaxID=1748243 RepID=A0A0S2TEA6_9GAMM|nr:hypothetical protein Tel_10095 [Candidatus Tenderia electrophaga]